MGSGNPVAKQFGVPSDPVAALKGIIANHQEDRTTRCCVMRCEVEKKDSSPETYYGATLAGFGQFGRSPGDLEHWHHRLPTLRNMAARLLGIEKLANLEYGLSLLVRFAWCALRPSAIEAVEVLKGEQTESIRLLAGAVMNFPLKALPLEPGVRVEDAALSLNFIPYPGRWASLFLVLSPRHLARKVVKIQISHSDRVDIRLSNRDAVEFFLDEDPMVFYGRVSIQVAGILAFVPGPYYQWPREKGGTP